MGLPRTVKECDRRLENCRITLGTLQIRSSKKIVWSEIDELLERRKKLSDTAARKAFVSTDSP